MILHQNNRFYFGNISFSLPDNICLFRSDEVVSDSGLELIAPDKSYRIDIQGYESEFPGKGFFEEMLEPEAFRWLGNVTPFVYHGISGCFLCYESGEIAYCEILFDLQHRKFNILSVLFYCKKNKMDIGTMMKGKAAQDLLNSFQAVTE